MEQKKAKKDYFELPHLGFLCCYTVFSILVIGESVLLGWEGWVLVLIAAAVVMCWSMHIRQTIPVDARIWVYAIMMMATAFFYGTHLTSTYDLGLLMAALVLVFISTGIQGLVTLAQITYYLAMAYDVFAMYSRGNAFDRLTVTRTVLHVSMMSIICVLARRLIRKWIYIMDKSEEEKGKLAESGERLNDFLANISHEIRTPVNAVIGLTRICIDKVDDEEVKRDLSSVMEAGKKVGDQISDILDYSEVDMGSLAVNEEDYMITSLLHDIVAELTPLKRQDLELVIDVDPRIPSTMRSDVTKLKKIIRHLIDNAIKYTESGGVYVHFTPEEREYGINLLIEVTDTGIGMSSAELEKVFERFYQADSGRSRAASGLGLGLSIVQGFVRSLNGFLMIESRPREGTTVRVSIPQQTVGTDYCMSLRDPAGLSLGAYLHFEKYSNPHVREFYDSMVRDLVLGLKVRMQRADNMAGFKKLTQATAFTHVFIGQMEYEEEPEFIDALAEKMQVAVICDASFEAHEGSKIRLMRKPFYCVPVISFVNSSVADQGEDTEKLYALGVRALVVDDEYMNHLVAKQILSGYGMAVSMASSGAEAVEYVRNNDVDIVFMDHMMPGMDGVEAMKRIRAVYGKERREVPIVALTANTVSTANEMFLREGFDAFLPKPIVITELERVLKKVLPKSLLTVEKVGLAGAVPQGAAGGKHLSAGESSRAGGFAGADEAGNGDRSGSATGYGGAADAGAGTNVAGKGGSAAGAGAAGSGGSAADAGAAGNVERSDGPAGSGNLAEYQQKPGGASTWEEKLMQLETLGIDTKTGLVYCLNDNAFYEELLLNYAGEAAEKIRNAERNLQQKDYKNYEILVHAVKSTSKMIGAMSLSEDAFTLEKAAKAEDAETILRVHGGAMKEYRHIADGILRIFGKISDGEQSDLYDEVLEFTPEPKADDEVLEFAPEPRADEEVLEFAPEPEADGEVLEFAPEAKADEEVLEFAPEPEADGEVLEFAPEPRADDAVLEFAPEPKAEEEVLEFAPAPKPDDDIMEFYPEGSDNS